MYSTDPRTLYNEICDGLTAIQHRGQDACGIVVEGKYGFLDKRGKGLVRDVLGTREGRRFRGKAGIGHVRYPTFGGAVAGADSDQIAQPLFDDAPLEIAMAHNGQITNTAELRERILASGDRITTQVDIEYGMRMFARQLYEISGGRGVESAHIRDAAAAFMDDVEGSYSVVGMVRSKEGGEFYLFSFAEPRKVMFSSESVSFDATGYEMEGDVQGGEFIIVDRGEVHRERLMDKDPRHCMFQYIYFARPSSVIEGVTVYDARRRMGEALGRKVADKGIRPMRIFGLPDSGLSYANGVSAVLGVPDMDAVDKNRYVMRAFITPAAERPRVLTQKINPVRSQVEGQDVLLIDDSIVRGETARANIRLFREAGARSVHLAVAMDTINSCYYGVDMAKNNEFFGRGISDDEIAERLTADSFTHLGIPGITDAIGLPLCSGCIAEGTYAHDVTRLARNAGGDKRAYEC